MQKPPKPVPMPPEEICFDVKAKFKQNEQEPLLSSDKRRSIEMIVEGALFMYFEDVITNMEKERQHYLIPSFTTSQVPWCAAINEYLASIPETSTYLVSDLKLDKHADILTGRTQLLFGATVQYR